MCVKQPWKCLLASCSQRRIVRSPFCTHLAPSPSDTKTPKGIIWKQLVCVSSPDDDSPLLSLTQRAPAFRELGDPALPHFPKFLPALPDEHTFNRTPGEISKAPNDLKVWYAWTHDPWLCVTELFLNCFGVEQASISSGHKPFEDALRSLKVRSLTKFLQACPRKPDIFACALNEEDSTLFHCFWDKTAAHRELTICARGKSLVNTRPTLVWTISSSSSMICGKLPSVIKWVGTEWVHDVLVVLF